MAGLVCHWGYSGPRRWLTQSSNILPSCISELVLKLPSLCLQMSFGWILPNLTTLLLWMTLKCVCVCDGADVYTALDSWKKSVSLFLKCHIWSSVFAVWFPPIWNLQCGKDCTNHTKWIVWCAKTKMECSFPCIWFSRDLKCIAFGTAVIHWLQYGKES